MLTQPVSVYINWSAYDELSDNVELTEDLAMRELEELLRLRALGVRFDYYLMDAFWYAPDGAYRTWRKPHWPDGPDRWLRRCLETGIKPGLWVATNNMSELEPHPAWKDSLVRGNWSTCLFHGGYLPHFMETLESWYTRGVRAFKFDFAHLGAATPELEETLLPGEIRDANVAALRAALRGFRLRHPDVLLLAYNGFEDHHAQSRTDTPFRKTVDTRWLEAFDSLYCGDPRPADVPAMNFWRAKDIYSDHMVWHYRRNGFPFSAIDNSAFMIGTTGTCYHRRKAAWKGMLLLSLARGGWMNTYYGALELLDTQDAHWFARLQKLYFGLQQRGAFGMLGCVPGAAQPYAFTAFDGEDGLIAAVNASQTVATIELPTAKSARVLFRDAGFQPELRGGALRLGPEQVALVGVGAYATEAHDFGQQDDVKIPATIEPVAAEFRAEGEQAITATIAAPRTGALRFVVQVQDSGGAKRISGGAPPNGVSLGKLITLSAQQGGREVPVEVNYDKAIWSGLSWAVGEVHAKDEPTGTPLTVRCTVKEPKLKLTGRLYQVSY
jgi:hypothetical protein